MISQKKSNNLKITPLKDIIIIKEHKRDDAFNVSELYSATVIKVGPDVTCCKPNDEIYFYQKNNRQIDNVYSFIFEEDVLFIEEVKND